MQFDQQQKRTQIHSQYNKKKSILLLQGFFNIDYGLFLLVHNTRENTIFSKGSVQRK